jgi:DNA-binding winged helix-turn-helix (wHTH) protein/tetratricopeptide (TPR) repeat protein
MTAIGSIVFPPYRLDLADERLLRGDEPLPLTPKAFAVLRLLAERAGHLVTKEDILRQIWKGTHVQDAVLKVAVREIRRTLEDPARTPRFIETVHRRGYRFVAAISHPAGRGGGEGAGPAFVGRGMEIATLGGFLERALAGERQVVFVTGEAGIGKTALVHAFLEAAGARPGVFIASGTCLEQYGAGEAYRPVLEALGRLARGPAREDLPGLLRRFAPTWLAQMPFLVADGDREPLRQEVLGATSQRMIREMAEAIEELTGRAGLLLVLEDLQWSDYSTLDLVATLGRRREPARLMILGTYREAEVDRSHHPLRAVRQELLMRRQSQVLPLDHLPGGAVAEYVTRRFPSVAVPEALPRAIHGRTLGNPLFMVNVVDHLEIRNLIGSARGARHLERALREVETGVPENLRQMIEKQVDRLSAEERGVLEAASVAGLEFSALAVAAGLGGEVARSDAACEDLARRGLFLRPTGVARLPDGTVTSRYGFLHPLYQSVLYQSVPLARRLRLHQRIGERGSAVYGDRASEIAAELAVHFEQARDYRGAASHLRRAAENAARRYANREAIDHLTRAFDLAGRLAEAERGPLQADILEQVGTVRRSMGDVRGAAEDFGAVVSLAREHADLDREARGLFYLGSALIWFDRDRFETTVAEALALSRRLGGNPVLRAHARGYAAYWRLLAHGWRAEDAGAAAEAIEAARRAGDRRMLGQHLVRHAYFLCLQSRYAAGCEAAREAARLALEAGDGFDYLLGRFFLAWGLLHAGAWGEVLGVLQDGLRMAERNGHQRWTSLFRLEKARLHQLAFDHQGALVLCEEALRASFETDHAHSRLVGRILLGSSLLALGQVERSGHCFEEAGDVSQRSRALMDWCRHMPLGLCAGEHRLARGELARARQEAERVRDLASGPGERTYLALAGDLLARVALAEGDRAAAGEAIDAALAALEGTDLPLAAWQVHATAAGIASSIDAAASHQALAAQAVERLATSLGVVPALRESFLGAAPVRAILSRPIPAPARKP